MLSAVLNDGKKYLIIVQNELWKVKNVDKSGHYCLPLLFIDVYGFLMIHTMPKPILQYNRYRNDFLLMISTSVASDYALRLRQSVKYGLSYNPATVNFHTRVCSNVFICVPS